MQLLLRSYSISIKENAIRLTDITDNGLSYFFMFAGSDETARPVRLTIDFINGLTDNNIGYEYSIAIVNEVCSSLKSEFSNITPRMPGFLIWEYMRRTKYNLPNLFISI